MVKRSASRCIITKSHLGFSPIWTWQLLWYRRRRLWWVCDPCLGCEFSFGSWVYFRFCAPPFLVFFAVLFCRWGMVVGTGCFSFCFWVLGSCACCLVLVLVTPDSWSVGGATAATSGCCLGCWWCCCVTSCSSPTLVLFLFLSVLFVIKDWVVEDFWPYVVVWFQKPERVRF